MISTECHAINGFEIPEHVAAIHGITNPLADTFGIGVELIDQLFATMLVKADVVVAHNIKFDLGMVIDNLPVSAEVLKTKQHFCTMENAKAIVGLVGTHGGGFKYPRLAEAYKHFFGADFANAHDAMADVRACRDVYFALTDPQTCRACGCTDADCSGCIARTGEACHWIARDLCSACA